MECAFASASASAFVSACVFVFVFVRKVSGVYDCSAMLSEVAEIKNVTY